MTSHFTIESNPNSEYQLATQQGFYLQEKQQNIAWISQD